MAICDHMEALTQILRGEEGVCEECVKTGARWVHLRTCQTCGKTLCCDSSPNKHASRHAAEADHPVVASAEPGEYWLFCFPHEAFAQYEP